MEEITIREATKEDCDAIMRNIKDLAVQVGLPEGPQTDAEVLRRDGFGEEKLFQCLVAEKGSSDKTEIIGHAMYVFKYSAWDGKIMYLDDLYVKPEHRGKGLGTSLWREVAKICLRMNCARMDWACLQYNTSAVEFYKRKRAIDLTEKEKWHLFRMTMPELETFVNEKL